MTCRVHDTCPPDGGDYYGRCLGTCSECGEHALSTGRYTAYCPSCDCCPDCGCPNADGFAHYAGCETAEVEEDDPDSDLAAYLDEADGRYVHPYPLRSA